MPDLQILHMLLFQHWQDQSWNKKKDIVTTIRLDRLTQMKSAIIILRLVSVLHSGSWWCWSWSQLSSGKGGPQPGPAARRTKYPLKNLPQARQKWAAVSMDSSILARMSFNCDWATVVWIWFLFFCFKVNGCFRFKLRLRISELFEPQHKKKTCMWSSEADVHGQHTAKAGWLKDEPELSRGRWGRCRAYGSCHSHPLFPFFEVGCVWGYEEGRRGRSRQLW